MKDGFGYQGAEVDTRFGSFGRRQVTTEAGMQSGAFAVYGAFEGINDDGFRDFSDAEVRRGYADLGLKTDNAEFHLNFTGADNYVGVTAAVPPELLAYGDKRTFTSPQTTYSDMQMYSLNGTVKATPGPTDGTWRLDTVFKDGSPTFSEWVGVTAQQTPGAMTTIVLTKVPNPKMGFPELDRLLNLAKQR